MEKTVFYEKIFCICCQDYDGNTKLHKFRTNVILEEINKYLDDNNCDDNSKIIYVKKELIKFMRFRNYLIEDL
jgi:uncharacterized membrane protein